MNKIYKLVWSKVRHCYVAVAEIAKSHGKSKKSTIVGYINGARVVISATLLVAGLMAPYLDKPVYAVSVSGSWVSGDFNYSGGDNGTHGWGYDTTFTFDNASLQAAIQAVGAGSSISDADILNAVKNKAIEPKSVTASGAIKGATLQSTGATSVGGKLTAASGEITGNFDVDGNLHVKGTSQLDKAVTIGTSGANANLTVHGNETLDGKLTAGSIQSNGGVAAGGKVTGVTAGTADTDAVNLKQLRDYVTANDSDTTYTAGNGLTLSGTTFSAKAGTNVTVNANGINVTGNGAIASGNTGLINGGTAYAELRPADGSYVKQNQTTAQNLTALDTQVKSNTDGITNLGNRLNDGLAGKANTSLDNLTDAGKTVVRDLAKESVTVVAGRNVSIVEGENGVAKTYEVVVDGTGKVAEGDTGLINGDTVFKELRPADGNYVEKNQTTAQNLTKLDTELKNAFDAIGQAGADTEAALATKADKNANNLTDEDVDAWQRKLGDGTIGGNNDTGLVTGNTVKQAITNLNNQMDDALELKADANASNVGQYAQQWADAIGKGSVSSDDTQLVTGKTVYDALHNAGGTVLTKSIETETIKADKIETKEIKGDKAEFTTIDSEEINTTDLNAENAHIDNLITDAINTNTLEATNGAIDHLQSTDIKTEDLEASNSIKTKDFEATGLTELNRLDVNGTANFKDNVAIDKDLNVKGDTHLEGDLDVDGTSNLGDTNINGLLTVNGDEQVNGNQDVTGKSTVGSQEVLGDSLIDGNQEIKGNLKVGGTSAFAGQVKINDDLYVAKDFVVDGDATFNGLLNMNDANVKGDLTVDGESNLKDTTIDGRLGVSDDVDFAKNLHVAGETQLDGNVKIGTDNKPADLAVTGNGSFGKDLTVEGNTDLKGDVNIGGDLHADNGTSYFDKSIWHEGEENQVEINETGIRVGLNSTHIDAHGLYAGGHSWDEAKAAMHEDGRIKGIYGYFENDLQVDGLTETGELKVNGDSHMEGNLDVAGDVNVGKNLTVVDNLNVGGDSRVSGDSYVEGNQTIEKDLTVNGNALINGNGEVVGDFKVDGASEFDGNITANQDLTVKGDAYFEKDVTVNNDFTVGGNTELGGDVHVTGNSQFDGDVNIAGNTIINKDLKVEGKTELNELNVAGDTSFNKNVTVGGDLDVAGNTNIQQDLFVGGDSHFHKDVLIDGFATIQKDIHIGGDQYVAGDSYVGGSQTINQNLTVEGGSTFKGDVVMNKNLHVAGDTHVDGAVYADKVIVDGHDLGADMRRIDSRIDKVGAKAAAIAGLRPVDTDADQVWSLSASYGNYKGENAGAVGLFYRPTDRVLIGVGGTIASEENMVNASLSVALNKGNNHGLSKTAMVKAVQALQKDNDALKRDNQAMKQALMVMANKLNAFNINDNMKAGFPDVPADHWANNAVSTLHGNGFVQGYPDGNFKGDEKMTRYEYAEMLYNALSKGAQVDPAMLNEYSAELQQVRANRQG